VKEFHGVLQAEIRSNRDETDANLREMEGNQGEMKAKMDA
jgi:hypothetical protein